NFVLIDDYAHHPTEIESVYQTVKEMYAGERNLVVFQPHLYSRTRDFASEFAEALAQFDEIILLDIYPAREEPIECVTAQWLLEKIKNNNKKIIKKEAITDAILKSEARLVLMLGAGDIGNEVDIVKQNILKIKTVASQ